MHIFQVVPWFDKISTSRWDHIVCTHMSDLWKLLHYSVLFHLTSLTKWLLSLKRKVTLTFCFQIHKKTWIQMYKLMRLKYCQVFTIYALDEIEIGLRLESSFRGLTNQERKLLVKDYDEREVTRGYVTFGGYQRKFEPLFRFRFRPPKNCNIKSRNIE